MERHEVRREPFIHPSCDVSPTAAVGSGSRVWNWSQIRDGAVVGRDSVIGQLTYLGPGVKIGDRCRLMAKVSIDKGVEIGNDVFIGPHVVFTNDRVPRAWTDRDLTTSRWRVEDGVSIGAHAVILPDVFIGHHAMVAANATVTHDVPPHALAVGSPARVVGWVCTDGRRMTAVRAVADGELFVCPECGEELLVLDSWKEGRWRSLQRSR